MASGGKKNIIMEAEWNDWVEEGPVCPGLFDPSVEFPDAQRCWADAKCSWSFDIVAIRHDWSK